VILFLLAAAATTQSPDEARFAQCVALTEGDAAKALEFAGDWQVAGGGVLARQCAGLAYASLRRWLPAATAFQQAAELAERMHDARAARLWVQAGNAAIAAGDMVKAGQYLDSALAGNGLAGAEAGEAHLDRARARVATNAPEAARGDLDMALKLVPDDPLAWLLSATLARRSGDLARARADIADYVAKYAAAAREFALRPAGRIAGEATRGGDGSSTGGTLGLLIADAQLAASRGAGAQIAFTNPFGIRTGLVPAG